MNKRMTAVVALALVAGGISCTREDESATLPFEPSPSNVQTPVTDTLYPDNDTYVASADNTSRGARDSAVVEGTGFNRLLVRFSQAGIAAKVGQGTLTSAQLVLGIKATNTAWPAGGATVDLHQVIKNWTEGGATWNCAIDSNTGNSSADCAGATAWSMASGSGSVWLATRTARFTATNGQSGSVVLDVTADVQAYLAGTATNYGWLLKRTVEGPGEGGRISFRTEEGFPKPQLVITVVPPEPPNALVQMSRGVLGSPASGPLSIPVGDSIPYSYSAATDYGDLSVFIDGVPSLTSGYLKVSDTAISVSTRRVTAAVGTEGIVSSAAGLYGSGSPVSAFQSHINTVMAYLDGNSDPDRFNKVEEAYSIAEYPGVSPSVIEALEDELVGKVFDVPINVAQGGQVNDSAQATNYVYVNGIWTNPLQARATALQYVQKTVASTGVFKQGRDSVKWIYNRSTNDYSNESADAKAERCAFIAFGRSSPGLFTEKYVDCIGGPPPTQPEDLIEAIQQYMGLTYSRFLSYEPDDVDRIRVKLEGWQAAGKNVILIPHSQGNMVVQQALAHMTDSAWIQTRDSITFATVPLAAPTAAGWTLAPELIKAISLQGDLVADNPYLYGFKPAMSSPLFERFESEFLGPIPSAFRADRLLKFFRLLGYGTELHKVNTAYFGQPSVEAVIRDSIREAYNEVTVGSVQLPQSAMSVVQGISSVLDFQDPVRSRNGRKLYGRRLSIVSTNPGVVTIDSTGNFQAIATGSAIVIVSYRGVADSISISVVPSPGFTGTSINGLWQSVGNSILRAPNECVAQLEIRGMGNHVKEYLDCGSGFIQYPTYGWRVPGMCHVSVAWPIWALLPSYEYCLYTDWEFSELTGGYWANYESWDPSYFEPFSNKRSVRFVRIASF